MSNALDLYSKVEDLLEIEEATTILNSYYFETLDSLKFKTLLDVGCGSGGFLAQITLNYPEVKAMGIDLSPLMVEQTQARGLDAKCIDLCHINQKFDVITAIFDMVNYLDAQNIRRFFRCIEERLEEGGYFIFDINTLYAFKEVAAGSFIKDAEDRFVTIDSDYYEEGEYLMEFTLFEKEGDRFRKSQETITQYYYTVDELVSITNLKLIGRADLSLYSDEVEKHYLIFRK